jgi:hypothetical protein
MYYYSKFYHSLALSWSRDLYLNINEFIAISLGILVNLSMLAAHTLKPKL